MKQSLKYLLALSTVLGCALIAGAQDNQEKSVELKGTTIFGSKAEVMVTPGSAVYLDSESISKFNYTDINHILQKVPGVYVRQEDGFGLFPNISLRGVDTSRSAKVTLMEDGVPSAPAIYSAPSAYFSPTAGRMSGLEVLKGSSQIKYGPHTTGGAINYISTLIPNEETFYSKMTFGTNNDFKSHNYFGDTVETQNGKFGFLIEGYRHQTDGFKELDSATTSNKDTGFENINGMLKLRYETTEGPYERFDYKIGYTNINANETYVGLSEADFKSNPYDRYQASQFDRFDGQHFTTSLNHYIEPSDTLNLTSMVYFSKFHRNWFKLKDVEDDTTKVSLSNAIAAGGSHLDVLKGNEAGTLNYRNNNRNYQQFGVQTAANVKFNIGTIEHDLTAGVRLHNDHVHRNQQNESFVQDNNGFITDHTNSAPGSGGRREQETEALSLWVEDKIDFGKLTVIPGIRFEHLDMDYTEASKGADHSGSMDAYAGGVGALYELTETTTLFAGVHKGISTPRPKAYLTGGIEEEESISTEVGFRYKTQDGALFVESTYFYTELDDLIVIDNIGGTGSGDTENAGNIVSHGLEFTLQYDVGIANNKSYNNPYYIVATLTNAEFDGDSSSEDSESNFSGAEDGNKVPYIPELIVSGGVGFDFEKFGVALSATYVDSTYGSGSNSDNEINLDGDPDSRFGKIGSYMTLDISTYYHMSENTKIVAGINNLLDEEYEVSRQPHGLRPGAPLVSYAGVELKF